ncbi:MAG: hypothetical protein JW772_03685 [Candidatus Diapherotrites archaeon]|nr:hypothetical protein [Candidatus Diapherotrites archaeon]
MEKRKLVFFLFAVLALMCIPLLALFLQGAVLAVPVFILCFFVLTLLRSRLKYFFALALGMLLPLAILYYLQFSFQALAESFGLAGASVDIALFSSSELLLNIALAVGSSILALFAFAQFQKTGHFRRSEPAYFFAALGACFLAAIFALWFLAILAQAFLVLATFYAAPF